MSPSLSFLRRPILGFCFCGMLLPGLAAEPVREVADAQRLAFKQQVLDLWGQKQFDELDRIAEESRVKKMRLADGWWRLGYFYDVLRLRYERHSRDGWLQLLETAEQWRQSKPQSITARVVLANGWTHFAWYSRSSSSDPAVQAEARALFKERLGKARQILEEAEGLPVKDPHLYNVMQMVARGEDWDRKRYEALYSKALQVEPTYYQFFYEKTHYLHGGKHAAPGEMEQFAAAAADATRSEEGEIVYMLIACCCFWDADQGEVFNEFKLSWPRIKQGFQDFESRYPNSQINLNFFCRFACAARDRQTAGPLFDRLGNNVLINHWGTEGEFEQWKRWAQNQAAPPVDPSGRSKTKGVIDLLKGLFGS